MARKTNVTGLKGLSIGSTKNNRGYEMSRYSVNYSVDGKPKSKSFYFGRNKMQHEAFNLAFDFMLDIGLVDESVDPKNIYSSFNHESRI